MHVIKREKKFALPSRRKADVHERVAVLPIQEALAEGKTPTKSAYWLWPRDKPEPCHVDCRYPEESCSEASILDITTYVAWRGGRLGSSQNDRGTRIPTSLYLVPT